MRVLRHGTWRRAAVLMVAATACGLAAWLAGCTNKPFDPASVANIPPVAMIYVTPIGGGDLNPTSYYERTFNWSGSDQDGFVVEYHVSIEIEAGVAAPWVTTGRTDTTMTFTTDDLGEAQALIRLACRDDRGAMSDTVSRYIPLQNFPPVINFTSEYDTTFASFGAANFRLFAIDLDGNVTMSDSVTYFLDGADTTLAPALEGTPEADPSLRPVIKQIDNLNTGHFDIDLHRIEDRGLRTLQVRVMDEADATGSFAWEWEVKPALSNVLLVDDFPGDLDAPFYYASMDSMFGPGGWSMYRLYDGLPDQMWVLLETFREFDAVFWYTGSSVSDNLAAAAVYLDEYLTVATDQDPDKGRLLLIAKGLIGSGAGSLPPTFVQETLGVDRTPSQPNFSIPSDKMCLSAPPGRLPDLHFTHSYSAGVGMTPRAGTEAIYQMEYYLFWSPTRRPPYEPVVGVRKPHSSTGEDASAVTLTLQFEAVTFADGLGAVRAMLENELGVDLP